MDTPLKILVATDEFPETASLRQAFAEAGVGSPVHFARDGQEVLDYLQGKPPFDDPVQHPLPDLLFLDVSLPRLGGLEVLEWVRRHPGLSQMLVVAFADPNHAEDIARADALGANSCVLKPRESAELVSMVARLQNYWLSITSPPGAGLAVQALIGLAKKTPEK
jgi:CheY-like chemotaxis protein